MAESETNEFKAAAQAEKARKLARQIYKEMLICVDRMAEEDWNNLAAVAGTTRPSETTRGLVMQVLKGKEPREDAGLS
jgi:hypothetical protein